jgi:hypothetical protein
MKNARLKLVPIFLLTATLPVLAESRPTSPELPIKRIVLFSSGVGYFQREGQVDGNARVDLQFHVNNINDLLKSLVLQDRGGGRIGNVNYDNRAPIEKTLKSFAIDLTGEPSMSHLLGQARGERVELSLPDEAGLIDGVIVGVEKQRRSVEQGRSIEVQRLNILTQQGLRSVELDRVQRIRFIRPELEQEFRKALEVLAAGHDKQKKTVGLNFVGNGKRSVRVGYLAENPIWKTSYRLSLDEMGKTHKAHLQGWAIIENTTDEDWSNVQMGLVSGRPISFQMDLYEPLYVPRPLVEPELFASLRPISYSGNLGSGLGGFSGGGGLGALGGLGMQGQPSGLAGRQQPEAINPAGQPGQEAERAYPRNFFTPRERVPATRRAGQEQKTAPTEKTDDSSVDIQASIASAALATELGEQFKYELEQPVSIPRQKSALIPIVTGEVKATRVSIYNEAVHQKYPLLGLRFKNAPGLHLMQGPVTVFEGMSYAGDARIPDLQPGEDRLLSYAIDLGTEIKSETPKPVDTLVAIKLFKGILHATRKLQTTTTYTIKNRSEHERLILVEHPYEAEWSLVTPAKPSERSRDVYRFEIEVRAGKTETLAVVEEQKKKDELAFVSLDDDKREVYLRSKAASPAVKQALEQAMKLLAEYRDTQREVSNEEQALNVITNDQDRMRANMARVPQGSQAYRRYLKKFDDQETEIEKHRSKIAELHAQTEKQRKAYDGLVLGWNVE